MNRESLYWILTPIVGLLVACTCFAGVDSSPIQRKQTHDSTLGSELRPITIVSTPSGARIVINGDYVGRTPLLVDFVVDKFGRAIRNMEVRAVAPITLVNEEIRRFPASCADSEAGRFPHF